MRRASDYFRKIKGAWKVLETGQADDPYIRVLQSFSDEISGRGHNVAQGCEGRKSLLISNALYLSSWEHRMVEIPQTDSESEMEFEDRFEAWLSKKRGI